MSFLKQILFSHFSNNQTWSIIYAQEDALPSFKNRMLKDWECIYMDVMIYYSKVAKIMLERIENQIRMKLKVWSMFDRFDHKNIWNSYKKKAAQIKSFAASNLLYFALTKILRIYFAAIYLWGK